MQKLHLSKALILAAMLFGCADSAMSPEGNDIAQQDNALSNPFAQCAQDARACVEAAGPDGDIAPCREQFQACNQAAIDAAKAKAEEVRACLEEARTCAQAATTPEDYQACRQGFLDCTGYVPPPPPPGAECITAFRDCVKAGTDVKECAATARTCLEAVKNPPPPPPEPAPEG